VRFDRIEVKRGSGTTAVPTISFELQREGSRSVYGDIVAYFTPRGKKEIVIGRANGLAVYVPNPLRRSELAIQLPLNETLTSGRLRMALLDKTAAATTLAAGTIDVP
jgi:hypothetical protein